MMGQGTPEANEREATLCTKVHTHTHTHNKESGDFMEIEMETLYAEEPLTQVAKRSHQLEVQSTIKVRWGPSQMITRIKIQ